MNLKTPLLVILSSAILFGIVLSCGCLGVSDVPAPPAGGTNSTPAAEPTPLPPAEAVIPPIEDIAFYIPGHTTILPTWNRTSEEFLEKYGPTPIMPDARKYTLLTFNNPIPDRGAAAVKLNFTIYGQEYSRILKLMSADKVNTDMFTYQGRINKSDENTVFWITVGPKNLVQIDFPWRNRHIDCIPIQTANYSAKTDAVLHAAYAGSDIMPLNISEIPAGQGNYYYDKDAYRLYILPTEINKSELTGYDEILTLNETDFEKLPEFRALISGLDTYDWPEISYETYVNTFYPEYKDPHKIYLINGKYYLF